MELIQINYNFNNQLYQIYCVYIIKKEKTLTEFFILAP